MPESALRWRICVRCHDDIRPTEITHPTGYRDEVICEVCEADARRARHPDGGATVTRATHYHGDDCAGGHTGGAVMQMRCVRCKRSQYLPAVAAVSVGAAGCVFCGHVPPVFATEAAYRAALAAPVSQPTEER